MSEERSGRSWSGRTPPCELDPRRRLRDRLGGYRVERTSTTKETPPRRRYLLWAVLPVLVGVLALAIGLRLGAWSVWNRLEPDWEVPDTSLTAEPEESTQTQLERVEDARELELELVSRAGQEPLSPQDVYDQCAPATVSLTVYSDDGVPLGTGSGMVLTEDGYLLTCQHVIAGAARAEVTTFDGTDYDALLVGEDAQTDLAVLKIQAQGLTPVQLGDSSELRVGDQALAIGDPLGTAFRGTLTTGIISAINRDVTVNGYGMTLIQTDAALNSGNSGGPLLNGWGQVVGVNNMKMISTATTVEGLGFAVPSATVRDIVSILSTQGRVSRPVLGITCYSVDQVLARENGCPEGLLVATINPASSFAGTLQEGDLITAVNGRSVTTVQQVKEILSECAVGQEVTLEVYRDQSDQEDSPDYQSLGTLTGVLVDQTELES